MMAPLLQDLKCLNEGWIMYTVQLKHNDSMTTLNYISFKLQVCCLNGTLLGHTNVKEGERA